MSKKCKNCNAEMADNMNFCPECRTKWEASLSCPKETITESIKMTVWQKLWQPRMARADYWILSLGIGFLVTILSEIGGAIVGGDEILVRSIFSFTITTAYGLFVLIWDAKRLHDSGKSAWCLLWLLLPIIGYIILIVLFFQPGDKEKNKYGEVPQRICSSN